MGHVPLTINGHIQATDVSYVDWYLSLLLTLLLLRKCWTSGIDADANSRWKRTIL